jgi:hypothetical protein
VVGKHVATRCESSIATTAKGGVVDGGGRVDWASRCAFVREGEGGEEREEGSARKESSRVVLECSHASQRIMSRRGNRERRGRGEGERGKGGREGEEWRWNFVVRKEGA